jgi:hypothetical protein
MGAKGDREWERGGDGIEFVFERWWEGYYSSV